MGVLINGYEYSFSSIKLKANDKPITGLKSIDYSNAIERGKVRGTGIQVRARTRGQADADGKLGFATLSAYYEFIEAIGDGYMEHTFDIVVSYADKGQPLRVDTVVACQFKKPNRTAAQGTDAIATDVDLDVAYVLENGLKPYADMEL